MLWRIRRRFDDLALAAIALLPAADVLIVRAGESLASIAAVGDIALGGAVERAVFRKGARQFVSSVPDEFYGSDLRLGNLEAPLTDAVHPIGVIGTFLKASPAMATVLTELKLDAVTLANNHALDYGSAALLDTITILDRGGIRHCGTTSPAGVPQTPVVLEAHELRFGILGYADECPTGSSDRTAPAPANDEQIVKDIVALKKTVNFVVLELHWGYEFCLYPLLSHRERARRLADAGADLILCHHAHVPMGLEVWNGNVIAYGLGNFIFEPTRYQRDAHPWTDRAYILRVSFGRDGITQVKIIPVGTGEDSRPQALGGRDRRAILGATRVLSHRLQRPRVLRRLELDRCAREANHFIRFFQDCASPADPRVAERALSLRSHRQQAMIRQLAGAEGSLRQMGALLDSIAQHAHDSTKLCALVARLRSNEIDAVVAASARQFAAALPGRRP